MRAQILILATSCGAAAATGVWTTPHDSYSSSVGVLGCKINTDRVAYWPGSVDCNNICVKLSYGGRSVHLLRIDQSGGAYDISYDAWNYLQTGKSATTDPITGGTVAMDYEEVDASECADLILTPGSKLPLSASNSINFLSSCLAQPNSWVAKNYVLYNICDAICTLGFDEECELNLAVSNQPSCKHTLGLTSKLTSAPVYNIQYDSGKTVMAGTGQVVPAKTYPAPEDNPAPAAGPSSAAPSYGPVQPAPTGGVFAEQSTSYAASTPPASYPASTPVQPSTYEVSSSTPAAVVPTTTLTPPVPYSAYPVSSETSASQLYTASPNPSKPSAGLPTTMSVSTVYSAKPSAPAQTVVHSFAVRHVGSGASIAALVFGVVVSSIFGVF